MSTVLFKTWNNPAVALFKHRRWWVHNVNPPGPQSVFVTEDKAFNFVTEDKLNLFVTEAGT